MENLAVKTTEAKEVKTTVAKKENKTATTTKKRTVAKKKETNKAIKEIAIKKKIATSIYNPSIYDNTDAKTQKSIRTKCRKKLEKVYISIFFYEDDNGKQKKRNISEALQFIKTKKGIAVKKDFMQFYKANYLTNDFTIASLYNGKKADKKREISDVLKVINPTT